MRAAVTVNEVKPLHFLIRARSTLSCNPINVFCAHILPLTCHLHKTEIDTLQDQDFSLYRFYYKFVLSIGGECYLLLYNFRFFETQDIIILVAI